MEAFPLSCPFQLYAKLGAEPGTKCSGKTALSTPHNFFITPLVLQGSRCMGCAGSSTWEGPVTRRYEDPTLTLPTQPVCYGFGGAHSHPDLGSETTLSDCPTYTFSSTTLPSIHLHESYRDQTLSCLRACASPALPTQDAHCTHFGVLIRQT